KDARCRRNNDLMVEDKELHMSAGTTLGCALWNSRPITFDDSLRWRLSDRSTKNSGKSPTLARSTRRIICIKGRLKLVASNHGELCPRLHRLPVANQPTPQDRATGLIDIGTAGLPHVIGAAVTSAVCSAKVCPTWCPDIFGAVRPVNDIDRIDRMYFLI